jgi:DNA-binding CsgD family transcriptional regulator
VGRDDEIALLGEVLDAARRGRCAAIVLRGEAGVGKSALLAYARAMAVDMTAVLTRGVRGLAELPFAGLSDLLRPLTHHLDDLLPLHRRALLAAIGMGRDPAPPLAVGAAFLHLLAVAGDARPVLVLVDDLHWVDPPSMDVVLFAARRLHADRVAFLMACRDEPVDALVTGDVPELQIAGVSSAAARALLVDDVSPAVATEIQTLTGGNVLAMLELAALLDDAQRRGRRPIDDPLPVLPGLRARFEARLRSLPPAVRGALNVAAIDSGGDAAAVIRAVRSLSLPSDAFDAAERAGIVEVGRRIDFVHPLLRAVVSDSTPAPDRRAAHRALARAFAAVGDTDRSTWHRAEACIGTDEAVATELARVATDARRRGASFTAARGFERAAGLTRHADERARHLLAAGEALWIGGRSERSVVLFGDALVLADDPALRADIAILEGQAEMWASGPIGAHDFLLREALRVETVDPMRAAVLRSHAVTAALLACDAPGAIECGEAARRAASSAGAPVEFAAATALGMALLQHGDPEADDLLAPAGHLAELLVIAELPEALHLVMVTGLADVVCERWPRAQKLLDAAIGYGRENGLMGLLPFALAVRADLQWRRGQWHDALLSVQNILELVEGNEKVAGALWAEAFLARFEAGRGSEACRTRAQRARRAGDEIAMNAVVLFADSALGLLELGLGHHDQALEHLRAVATMTAKGEIREPGILWWAGDYIEAAWRAGRTAEAAGALRTLEAQADATGRVWALAVCARARGALAGRTTYRDEFAEALQRHDVLGAPFELARTKLCYGERLREHGEHDEGLTQLREAGEVFTRLGAGPWIARTQAACGDDATSAVPPLSRLSDRELQVAVVVGHGATNQEAATELFLSAKTIDFHLRNVYRKLGVRSRSQLALLLSREGELRDA